MMLNVLFVICSLPVVTVGSSLTASFRVARLLADKSCDHVVPQFFRVEYIISLLAKWVFPKKITSFWTKTSRAQPIPS